MNDETWEQESITEGRRALDLFTNRQNAIRLFCEYLNDEPAHDRVLFFYGAAGNGKSLLLRLLRERYCKRLHRDDWNYVKTAPQADFTTNIEKAENATIVPSVLLDFKESSKDAFNSLLSLRRGLAGHHVPFPLFDFSCIWYLHKAGQLDESRGPESCDGR